MFLVIHALMGSIIGLNFSSVFFIIFLAFLSHFLLDIVPHWDGYFDKEHFKNHTKLISNKKTVLIRFVDLFFVVLLMRMLSHEFNSSLLTLGALTALAPDAFNLGYFTRLKEGKRYKKYLHFHNNIQKETGFLFGLLTQITLFTILITILF